MLPGDAKIPGRAQEKKTSASRHVGGPLVPGPRAAMVVSWWPGICGCSLCPCTFQGAGKRWLAIANRERDSQTRVRKRINRTVCSSVFASSHHQQNIIRTFTSVQSINQPINQSSRSPSRSPQLPTTSSSIHPKHQNGFCRIHHL
jgi:hypothetical protein